MKHQQFFYVEPQNVSGNTLIIEGAEYRHLVVVNRKKHRDIVDATDGQGTVFTFIITDIGKSSVKGEILKRRRNVGEPHFKVTLVQAIPKGGRFDWVVEKGTEVGVTKFIPLVSERSVASENSSKAKRWQRIALAAMKQCCRSILPQVTEAMTLEQVLKDKHRYDYKLLAHADEESRGLAQVMRTIESEQKSERLMSTGIILIGPEGGFTTHEVARAREYGYRTFSLGPRRLRCETAGIVAATLLLQHAGEME